MKNNLCTMKRLIKQFILLFSFFFVVYSFSLEKLYSYSNNIPVKKDENYDIDVIHYKINIEFKPDEKIILFENEIEFQLRNNNIDKISFDYNPIILDSQNNEFVFYVSQKPESLIFDEEYQILRK